MVLEGLDIATVREINIDRKIDRINLKRFIRKAGSCGLKYSISIRNPRLRKHLKRGPNLLQSDYGIRHATQVAKDPWQRESSSRVSHGMKMSTSNTKTLTSDLKPRVDWSSKLVTEYLLEVAKKYAEDGRKYYMHEAFTDRKKYFKHLDTDTRSIASALHKEGFREGDTLMYISDDLIEIVPVYMSVWRLKAIVRACHLEDDDDTLVNFATESKVKYIVCDQRCNEKALRVRNRLDHPCKIIFIGEESETPKGARNLKSYYKDPGDQLPKLSRANPDDCVLILCTSGTTGKSKGAVHSHYSLLTIMGICLSAPLTFPDPNLAILKSTHISGSLFPFGFLLDGKSGIVTHDKSEQNILIIIEAYHPGLIFCFPTFLSYFFGDAGHSRRLDSIEEIFTGGAVITSTMRTHLTARLPKLKGVCVSYAITEAGVVASNFYCGKSEKRHVMQNCPPNSVGKVCPGVTLQIRNPDTKEILGCREIGEIWTKSVMFQGYFKNESMTKESIVDGFFRTGDIGYYDEQGWIFVVDRLKEIFKYAGFHVSPSELESLIQEYDAVEKVSVVGIPETDGVNSLPRAWVVLNDKYKQQANILQEIADDFNSKVSNYKKLRGGIYVIDKLPQGKTGKVLRNALETLDPADYPSNKFYNRS